MILALGIFCLLVAYLIIWIAGGREYELAARDHTQRLWDEINNKLLVLDSQYPQFPIYQRFSQAFDKQTNESKTLNKLIEDLELWVKIHSRKTLDSKEREKLLTILGKIRNLAYSYDEHNKYSKINILFIKLHLDIKSYAQA